MDTRPKLPHDVLLIIASFADTKCILSLLATSRNLHSDCAKFLLHHEVLLHDDYDVVSFIYFMRPNKRKRWRHLRALHFGGEPIDPRTAEELARVIPRASHLESLEFGHAEKTLGSHPNLAPAFAAVRTVKRLVIQCGYQHSCRMLEAMHWPLENVVLSHAEYTADWKDPDKLDRMHPAALLKNCRATLKFLRYDTWLECSDVLGSYPVYPLLESLHALSGWCPRATQWSISYPGLKRLCVHTVETDFMDVDEDSLAEHAANRARNLDACAAQDHQWDELEQFSGGALDLYLLGLTCRIRDLHLSMCAESLQFFAPAIATARPTRLTLSIDTTLFSQPVPTYLQEPGLEDLRSLELRVRTWVGGRNGYQGDTDVDHFLGHVSDTLRRVSACEFSFYLKVESSYQRSLKRTRISSSSPETDGSDDPRPPPVRHPSPSHSVVEAWASNADPDALANRILDEVPSLELIKVSVTPSETHRSKEAEASRKRGPIDRVENASPLTS